MPNRWIVYYLTFNHSVVGNVNDVQLLALLLSLNPFSVRAAE